MNIHKLALFIVLALGGAFLVYNAVSIVNGTGGLASLQMERETRGVTDRML